MFPLSVGHRAASPGDRARTATVLARMLRVDTWVPHGRRYMDSDMVRLNQARYCPWSVAVVYLLVRGRVNVAL